MIKVLHVGEYMKGGLATYANILIKDDIVSGTDNYLFMSKNNSEKQWNISEKKIRYYDYKRGLQNIISAINEIQKEIERVNPNIVLVYSTWAGLFVRIPYLLKLKKKNIKIIYNAHGWAFLRDTSRWKKCLYAIVEQMLSRVTDKIINVSESEQRAAIQYGLNPGKLLKIYSGIEDSSINVEKISLPKFDTAKINLLFVGRFDRPKGLDWLRNIIDGVEMRNIHLYVIGGAVVDGDTNGYDNNDNITYLGWVDNSKIDGYYQMCDAVIMPSRWEAFGFTAIEGMKNEKPIIASNRGALPELVTNGVNGYIFEMENNNSFIKILKQLDKKRLILMGLEARKIYEEKFNAVQMRTKLFSLYKDIIGGQYEN